MITFEMMVLHIPIAKLYHKANVGSAWWPEISALVFLVLPRFLIQQARIRCCITTPKSYEYSTNFSFRGTKFLAS